MILYTLTEAVDLDLFNLITILTLPRVLTYGVASDWTDVTARG